MENLLGIRGRNRPTTHAATHARLAGVALVGLLWGCAMDSSEDGASAQVGALPGVQPPGPLAPAPQGTNVSFGGAQDVGFLRDQLEAGLVPSMQSLDAPGFFAEHFIELPPPSCGERLCLTPMVAVMGNLSNGNNCTMLHVGLRSPSSADPANRPPLALALVVDVSGSMMGEKIEYVRSGLRLLVDGMLDDDQLALITYSDAASVVVPMGRVGDNRVALGRAVDALRAEGGTNLHGGLIAGYRQVLDGYDSERQNRVILLSDGNPTAGVTAPQSILDDSRAYNSDGVGLTTVGLGADFNIALMRGLAQQADGNFYFLEDADAIDEVFEEELSYFVVPIAFDLELSLTAGPEYEFGRALGAPLWQDTGTGGELSIPSVFVAHRESADDVTEDGGRRGGGSSLLVELMPAADARADNGSGATIAAIDLTYRAPGMEPPVHDRVELIYPHAPDQLLPRGYFAGRESNLVSATDDTRVSEPFDPAAIQKSFVMLNVFVGMESAVAAFHTRSADARTIAELDNLIDAVEDYNQEVGDADIAADLELLAMLRRNLISAGIASSLERERAFDPWPAD
jgi:Ca-activated chloride channel family protein